jgi:hypothetical protein
MHLKKIEGMKIVEVDSVDNRGIMFPVVKSNEVDSDSSPVGNDVTADKAIREALNIAVDRQEIVDGGFRGIWNGSSQYL